MTQEGKAISFADRLKRAALAAGDALGVRRRPGVELVRLDPALAPPPPPWSLRALPAPDLPLCPRCQTRHEPRPHPAAASGLAAAYGRTLLPDPTRPESLGRGPAHDKAVYRDQANPWRDGTPDPPPLSLDLAEIREEFFPSRTYWWEQRDQ